MLSLRGKEKGYISRITVSKRTKELLKDCIQEFKNQNPEFKDAEVSEDFITERAFEYYLGVRWIKL